MYTCLSEEMRRCLYPKTRTTRGGNAAKVISTRFDLATYATRLRTTATE